MNYFNMIALFTIIKEMIWLAVHANLIYELIFDRLPGRKQDSYHAEMFTSSNYTNLRIIHPLLLITHLTSSYKTIIHKN